MDKLEKVHFSLSDWLYEEGKRWFVTTAKYVSPPSSLSLPSSFGGPVDGNVALKEEVSGNLKLGRCATYIRNDLSNDRMLSFFVRAQTSPHLGNPSNCYRVDMTHAVGRVYRIVDNGTTTLKQVSTPFSWQTNTWYHFRATWWAFLDANLEPVLRFFVEYFEDEQWKPWLVVDEADPYFEDAEHNLFGFYAKCGYSSGRSYIDDTEVWKPKE